ncbi:MAG TPA: NAD(P)-dependent oxidoreductase [Steroidobacteraceae bacterium]|jgi:3-hydroxyisobutyrate dehydrogenase|nr:NAD(P)-dependent oxidoreductase [Steroidobacteraceae bacterium]
MKIGWIGLGRMGFAMAQRLLQAGHALQVWNRTRSKAQPLAAHGAVLVERKDQLAATDVLFTMLATGKDLQEVLFGSGGVAAPEVHRLPGIIVDCSTIGADESGEVRERLAARGVQLLSAPVSGNPGCVAAGKLSSVVSGPRESFERVEALIRSYAVRGVSYVGEGELSRVCKLAHNVFLAVVIENLIEVTLLAQKAGVPRHAFLQFMNDSALGSIFTRYKSPALVNLEFKPTFTTTLLCKDVDLGLAAARSLEVAMPVTAAAREVLQAHVGTAMLQPDAQAYLAKDFATLIETLALQAGIRVQPENVPVASGLETGGVSL